MDRQWQLIDRPSEFGAIRSALTGSDGRGVILVGDAGVGKTTIARTVTESLRSKIYLIACTESSRSIPLGAFAPFVGASATRDPLALMALAQQSLATDGDAIVYVDDAHMLDDLSATLLHQRAVERTGRILATVRRGEAVPDAVTALWKDGYLRRIDLEPFAKAETIALAEKVLGGTIEGLSADVMWNACGGNPLYLRHLIEGSIDAGTLMKSQRVWQLRGVAVVPPSLAALIEGRLTNAGDDVVTALRLLALCEPLEIDALSEMAGAEAVDAAELQGLIQIVHNGAHVTVRFSHPLFGDVVRRGLGTASARKLRGRIVRVLRDRALDSAASRIQMAQLYVDSDEIVDADLLITAAKDAIFLSNLPLGEQLARGAVERDGGLRASELLARARWWQGHPVQAEAALAKFDPKDMSEFHLVQWGITRISILFWSLDVDRANEVLALLRERVQHPSLKLVVEATGALTAVHENRIADGIAAAERVLSNPNAPIQAVDSAAFSAGLAMPVAGRGADFEPIAARCRAEQKPTDGMIRVMVRYCDVLALAYIGELDLADKRAADYADFSSSGQFLAWAIAKITAGVVATFRGNFPEAISAIEQALAALAAEDPLPWRLPARALLARSYAALGSVDQAERVLADAAEHSGRSVAVHGPHLMVAKAWVVAAKGLHSKALEMSRAAADAARKSGQFAVEAQALHDAARFGDTTVADRLAALVEQVDGTTVALQARHAAAVAAADAQVLDAVSRQFEEAGLLLSAADSAAQAALLYDRTNQRSRNHQASARAVGLAQQCGGALTPAIEAAARPLPLTSREREIAGLIAVGQSNKQIAEQLTLSVRTIEGHVYRACLKLGIADRDELAKLMRDK